MRRRDMIRNTLLAGGVLWAGGARSATAGNSATASAAHGDLIQRTIPVSGERLPVLGLGTNNYSPTTSAELQARKEVLQTLTAAGASVVDTAPAYRESEQVLGGLLAEIGNRKQVFLATKVTAQDNDRAAGEAMLEESMRRLRTTVLDLVQVHNLTGAGVILPILRAWQRDKRIRYVGITTSRDEQYPEMLSIMRSTPLDFIQVDYSIANRSAAEEILPLAVARKIAVLINLPFGGRRDGNLFGRVRDRQLPDWAAEFDAASWGQFLLKYVLSHPAVTCAIPGMTRLANLTDNLQAARGRLPDGAQRARMARYWDEVVGS
ncbi:MAG TPA: aldo/keto reductase [Steroidobacteraceae bacterium]|nr:aldo/keto reductase [Steroidobacteraceae bacterium]HRX91113.1 aldo/keto reductase [Steroidobacteraceae bacterium]